MSKCFLVNVTKCSFPVSGRDAWRSLAFRSPNLDQLLLVALTGYWALLPQCTETCLLRRTYVWHSHVITFKTAVTLMPPLDDGGQKPSCVYWFALSRWKGDPFEATDRLNKAIITSTGFSTVNINGRIMKNQWAKSSSHYRTNCMTQDLIEKSIVI